VAYICQYLAQNYGTLHNQVMKAQKNWAISSNLLKRKGYSSKFQTKDRIL
jgi:hypothetical protein